MAADKNSNTRRKVVANSNRLCLGIVVNLLDGVCVTKSLNGFTSEKRKIRHQTYLALLSRKAVRHLPSAFRWFPATSIFLKVPFRSTPSIAGTMGDSLPLSPSRVSELSVSEWMILSRISGSSGICEAFLAASRTCSLLKKVAL